MLNFLKKNKKQENTENLSVDTAERDRKKAIREGHIADVMKKTKWTHDEAEEAMKAAKKKVGITYRDYNKYNFHKVDINDQEAGYQKVLERKERRRQQKEECITSTMTKKGWSREETLTHINAARNKFGIKYKEYAKYNFCNLTEEEQARKWDELVAEKKAKREEKKHEKENTIRKVMSITGWDYGTAEENIDTARKRTGCQYKEYLTYKFYDLDEETQNSLFLVCHSKAIAAKYDTDKNLKKMLVNKELTNDYFSDCLRRPWCVNTKITCEDFVEKFKDSKRIIYKPLDGNRGFGVEAYDIDENNAAEIYNKLKTFADGVVEKYVVQHAALTELAPASVNTVRIVTISTANQMDIAYAALRIGGGTSIVDNFHSGGMVAAIDLETGELATDAADMDGNVFVEHPMTGVKIQGFIVPHFDEALKLVREAYDKRRVAGYLGWDIAITEEGPVLIELNRRPGAVLLTTPYISQKKGMKYVMDKFI